MAIISSNIKLPTTGGKKTTTGGTTVKLPTTGGTYTSYLGTGGGTSTNPTTPIALQGSTPTLTGGVGTGVSVNNGGTYTNYLTTVVEKPSGSINNGVTYAGNVGADSFNNSVTTAEQIQNGNNSGAISADGAISGDNKVNDTTFTSGGSGNSSSSNSENKTQTTEKPFETPDLTKTNTSTGTGGSGTTYTENLVSETGDTGGGDTGDTGSTGEIPMTYQEYYAEAMKQAEADKAAAVKRAEVAEERAMADAQASYMQNMATYGANAEQLAQMGLTGGGYSDYLNAQAYAQKREDAQVATANKNSAIEAAESTYADNVLGLKKEMADITYAEGLKKDEEAKEAAEELTSNYNGILIEVQANPDSFNETGLRAWCKNNGFDETQTQSVVDTWKEATALADAALDVDGEEKTPVVMSDVIKDIQAGAYVKQNADGSTTPYTWEEIKSMLLQARNDGENITQEDIENAKKAYDEWIAYRDGRITTDDYYDAANGDEEATAKVDREMNTEQLKQEAKDKVGAMFTKQGTEYKAGSYNKNAVDTFAKNYNPKSFGNFYAIGDADSTQGKYVRAIVNDAKAGKIPVGSLVGINYGEVSTNSGTYIYMGDGIFVNVSKDDVKTTKGEVNQKYGLELNTYVPDGYHIHRNGKIYDYKGKFLWWEW